MTKREWIEVIGMMQGLWPSYRPTEQDVEVTYPLVADVNREDVIGAVNALARDGREFAPPVGLVLSRVQAREDRVNILPFGPALRLAQKAVAHSRGDEGEALSYLEARAPAVARWITAYGYREFRLEPVDDPDKGSMIRARLEKSYEKSCREYREERADGLSITQNRMARLGAGTTRGELTSTGDAMKKMIEEGGSEDKLDGE